MALYLDPLGIGPTSAPWGAFVNPHGLVEGVAAMELAPRHSGPKHKHPEPYCRGWYFTVESVVVWYGIYSMGDSIIVW